MKYSYNIKTHISWTPKQKGKIQHFRSCSHKWFVLNKMNSNTRGEMLRSHFFVNGDFDVPTTPAHIERIVLNGEEISVFHAIKTIDGKKVLAQWYWQDDWVLSFFVSNGVLTNKDAKKDHGWEWEG